MEQVVGSGFAEFLDKTRHEPVYVILGVQGSGTNLLARLLTRLFDFSVVRDGSVVFTVAARLGQSPATHVLQREIRDFKDVVEPSALRRKTRKAVLRDPAFRGLIPELQAAGVSNGAEFAKVVYAYRAFSTGATRIAIKSDDLWQGLHLIEQVIPNRRIILLTRDFRDNLLSISGKGFGPIEPICAARYVKDQLAYYVPEYRRAGSTGYHVKFETLLNATREFADDFARRFQVAPTVDLDTAIPTQFRPNKIGKWKRLSERELSWCEGILHDELLEFGYPLASPAPAVPASRHVLAANVRDTLKRVPQKIRRVVQRLAS